MSKQKLHKRVQAINKEFRAVVGHYKSALSEKGFRFGTPIPLNHPEIRHVEKSWKALLKEHQQLRDKYCSPEVTDKWQHLEMRCEATESIIASLALLNDRQAIEEVVKDLWRRAQHAGGIHDLPPDMPPISDGIQAIQATGLLLRWVKKKRPNGGKAKWEVERWSDLGIAIDEKRNLHAFCPCPSNGAAIRLSNGTSLDLPGKRWPKMLQLLARSPDGRTALINDLQHELGRSNPRALSMSREQAQYDEGLTQVLRKARRTLSNTIADLGRELRALIISKERTKALSIEDDKIRSAFVSGILVKDKKRAIHFAWGPVAG
jgi:hypothetical protein